MADIKRLIKDAFVFQKKISEFQAMVKDNMRQIQEHFDKVFIKELTVEAQTEQDTALIAKKSERVTIDYDVEKLKKKLDSEVFNEIVRKTYVINDMPALIAVLKSYGVKPADFKKFIDVSQDIDRASVRRLYDTGDIGKDHLKGCYTAKVVKSIKITPAPKDG